VISYAQNAEDVVLARLFTAPTGRYVDIGAGDPVVASVTKHFYDRGWRGVNVEPIPSMARKLAEARPGDVNLAVAVGAKPGKATLHVVAHEWGWSTLDDDLASGYREDHDWEVNDVEVELTTLADLLDDHPGDVDFLKIDVEGAEQDVIEGADWSRHRPRVLVVEATDPGSPTPAHEGWEHLLVAAGYRCGLFDGLNRFYAQADDDEALTVLASPANVFDKYEPYETAQLRATAEELHTHRAAEIGYIRRLEAGLREMQDVHEKDAAYVKSLEDAVAEEQRRAMTATRYSSALESRVAELETAAAAAAKRLALLGNRTTQDRTPR
jgi:FkbM family methyltransferase